MGMGTDIGIDAEGYLGHLAALGGQLVDNLKLRNGLYVEAEDVLVESQLNLPVGLAYTGIDDVVSWEACLQGSFNLTSADTVGSQTALADDGQYLGIGISLDGIVYYEAVVASGFGTDGLEGVAQQTQVVVVEGGLPLAKLLYGE